MRAAPVTRLNDPAGHLTSATANNANVGRRSLSFFGRRFVRTGAYGTQEQFEAVNDAPVQVVDKERWGTHGLQPLLVRRCLVRRGDAVNPQTLLEHKTKISQDPARTPRTRSTRRTRSSSPPIARMRLPRQESGQSRDHPFLPLDERPPVLGVVLKPLAHTCPR